MKIERKILTDKINQFEWMLGDPTNISNLLNFDTAIKNDEKSLFPVNESNFLNSLEINRLFIPKSEGGDLLRFDELMLMFRSIFRRDPSVALGYGMTTFMASIHIWIFGSDEQKRNLARIIKTGHTVSISYHEKNNGNDIASSKVYAKQVDNEYSLEGQKWIINNASESKAVTLFVKTGLGNNSKDYTLFFLEKDPRYSDRINYLRKIKTSGVRACRISGFNLTNYPVSEKNAIKGIGFGVEQTFKSFQITRAILPGMSLGAADTYLRKVYGLINLKSNPTEIEKDILAENFIGLLICDLLSIVATRSIHVIPEQLSIISAITKYFVPQCILKGIHKLTDISSVESLTREGGSAVLKKLLRDYPVVSFGHSNDVVCLSVLLNQIKQLTSKYKLSTSFLRKIKTTFCLDHELPDIDFSKLKMSNSGYLDVINSIFLLHQSNEITLNFNAETIDTVVKVLKTNLHNVKNQVDDLSLSIQDFSQKTYSILDLYSRCYVATCCLYFISMNKTFLTHYIDENKFILAIYEFIFTNNKSKFDPIRDDILKTLEHFCQHKLAFSFLTMNYL